MTMKLIETKTLGAAAASIEFTSIPQTYTDLVVLVSCRTTTASVGGLLDLTFNSQTSNRSSRNLLGDGASTSSATSTAMRGGRFNGATSTSNTFSNSYLYIPNYAGASAKTSSVDGVIENNATDTRMDIVANLWNDTSAITSIKFTEPGGDLVAGSTISLYGILKGSDGIVTTS